jgi:hypothetical protein
MDILLSVGSKTAHKDLPSVRSRSVNRDIHCVGSKAASIPFFLRSRADNIKFRDVNKAIPCVGYRGITITPSIKLGATAARARRNFQRTV